MNTLIQNLHSITPKDFLSRSLKGDYPIVFWKEPYAETRQLIVQLSNKIERISPEIECMKPGFIINSFKSSHPSKPYFVKSDIHYKWNDLEYNISINPSVSSGYLDDYLSYHKKTREFLPKLDSFKGANFCSSAEKAIDLLKKNKMKKVVLSFFEDHTLPVDFDPVLKFEILCRQYPNAFIYLLYSSITGLWMGATPENLLTVADNKFSTVALAGTQTIEKNQSIEGVAWKQKEIEEQAMVSRYIIDCFKKIRLREFEEIGPRTVRAANLAHLSTSFHVDMLATNTPELGSVMLDLLHPTSAVCGMPREQALDFIHKHEHYERKLFTGYLGPVNIRNKTAIFVNLRCAELNDTRIRFYAGAGITNKSSPKDEETEIQQKLKTLKNILL